MERNKTYDAFVCYSRQDSNIVRHIASMLEANGLKCFTDYNSIFVGVDFVKEIQKYLIECNVTLFFISENSVKQYVTAPSWLNKEINYAVSIGKPIIPIRLDNAMLPPQLQGLIGNLNYIEWYKNGEACIPIIIRSVNYYLNKEIDKNITSNRSESEVDEEIRRLDMYSPQKIDYDIFLSYRRDGGRDCARTIKLQLGNLGYKNVFYDYNSIRDGVFNTQILDAIYSCKDFLLLLTPNAMDRCIEKGDWVAREIRTAIKYNCKIIPISLGDIFDWPTDFPIDMNGIKSIQRHKLLVDEYFEDSIIRLSKRLSSIPITKVLNNERYNDTVNYKIMSNKRCRISIDGEEQVIIEKDVLFKIPLRVGYEYYVVIADCENQEKVIKKTICLEKDKVEVVDF